MLVKDLIAQLQELDPNENIVAAYWDRETLIDNFDIEPEYVNEVLERFETYDFHDANDVIYLIYDDVVGNNDE